MKETAHYKLKKPEANDYANIQALNDNADVVDRIMAEGDIDCGTFAEETNQVALHNRSAQAHTQLQVDGNENTALLGAETLEEHVVDPQAHPNLELDGNMN